MELLKIENRLREGDFFYETELKVQLAEYFKMILDKKGIGFKDNLKTLYYYDYSTKNYNLVSMNNNLFKELDEKWDNHIVKNNNFNGEWNDYYYLLIKILTFGKINKILELSIKDSNGKYKKLYELFSINLAKNTKFKIGNRLENLKTISILRNALCHKESLVIFLEKEFRKSNKKGEKRN